MVPSPRYVLSLMYRYVSYVHPAWKSADYLQDLLNAGAIRSEPNDIFAEYYPDGSADLVRKEDERRSEGTNNENERGSETNSIEGGTRGEMLLSSKGVTELVKGLQLQDRALSEISKALEQTAARLQKANKDR